MGDTMEIGTYLRALGWRSVLVGALLLASIGGPIAAVLRQPVTYVAVAAVRAPAVAPEGGPSPADQGEGEGSQLAAELGAILALEATRTGLAAETGVSVAALKARLTVTRAGSVQFVDVTFRDTSRVRARQVARSAALRALSVLAEERLVAARFALESVEKRLEEVKAVAPPEPPLEVYDRARADEARLERLVIGQLAAGDPTGAASAKRALEVARGGVAAAAQQLVPYERAVVENEAAQEAVNEARKEFVRLEARNRALRAARSVTNGPVRREVPVKLLASVAIGGGLAAGILSFGLITLVEVRAVLARRLQGAS